MLPQCSHINRKRGVYYFRRRLPLPYGGEVAVSLQTRSFPQAMWLANGLRCCFDQALEGGTDMHPDVESFLKTHLREALAKKKLEVLRAGNPSMDSDEWYQENRRATRLQGVLEMQENMRSALRACRSFDAMPAAKLFAEEHGLPRDADNMAELSLGLVQVSLQMFEQEAEWLTHGVIARIPLEPLTVPLPVTPSAEPVEPSGETLLKALADFAEHMENTGSWKGQTLSQSTTTFRIFTDLTGDVPLSACEKKHTRAFYDLLKKLPSNYSRPTEWKDLPLPEIVALTDGQNIERLSMKTIQRHFAALGKFFQHVRGRGEYQSENPAHGFSFPTPRRKPGRKQWEGQKLAKLFASPVWTGCQSAGRRGDIGEHIIKDEKYWLPILGLYHGNRLEEFAQLRREDIQQDGGIWFFNIHDADGRQTKNEQSNRRVPLHPEVQRLGFLDYVNSLSHAPETPIFTNLKPGGPDKKLGTSFTKWFGRYKTLIGLGENLLDYHSFRHTVTTKLYAAGVDEVIIDTLVGHERKGTSASVYLHELPLKTLFEALSKVTYDEVSIRP